MSKTVKKIDPELDARQSGSFKIGGVIDVHRLGFGAMRITGPGIFGPPEDRDEAVATLKRVPELGINFIDTADSYGPDVSEELIREVLYPYDGLLIATKAGLERPGPACGRSTAIRGACATRRSRVARNSAWSKSGFGSCIASIRKCRPTSSSALSGR